MRWSAGIDIGGTNLKAVAISADGAVLKQNHHPTISSTSPAHTLGEQGRAAIAQLIAGIGSAPASIGVCAPGLAAADERSIAYLPEKLPGLPGLDWTTALDAQSMVPVLNDAQAALLGEAWQGAARNLRHVVMLTLGTGVGGAVIVDGRLLRGAIGRAGHFGHMSLDPDGPASITGMPGALEMLIGDCSVAERTAGRFLTTAALVHAHRAGDAAATHVWLRSVRGLACAIGSAINLFDPEIVVLGGGIAQAGEALFAPLMAELDRVEWRPGGHRVTVVPAMLGEWAGAIGAARNSLPA
jgi:glucokinase